MRCPHCTVSFHDNWDEHYIEHRGNLVDWWYRTAHCPACKTYIIEATHGDWNSDSRSVAAEGWRQIYPPGSNRGPVPPEVPKNIAADYIEACLVLPLSPKASAALSRRCLQNILHNHGYTGRDLAKQIDLLLNETDASKAITAVLRTTIDGIRNFGNFSAHPITDVSTLQVIDVEPHEAEWCLEILEEMFQHFYVRPAAATARKALLDAKLAAAGKPPSK
jgi:hypothetical protein